MEHNYFHETYDCVTGETTIVPVNDQELAEILARQAEAQERADAEAARIAAEEQKAAEEAARLSAKLAIYAKLGLTEEEINTLIS
jgi:hypothetical protein